MFRIYLSPPHMGSSERDLLLDAFDSNWVAPLGPHVDAFERELAESVQVRACAALSSGTGALHLALKMLGVGPGDVVLTSTLTFAATAFAIDYVGATPIFIDSNRATWNMDPDLLGEELQRCKANGDRVGAILPVHLYGQCCDMDPILALGSDYGVPVIEDAAEALGATYKGRAAGSMGRCSVLSFNGNKIITTSGGGAFLSPDPELASRARFLATQAREPMPHYEHVTIGHNYRMSNLLAAVGRGQLRVLPERVARRREHRAAYHDALSDLPGLRFMPDAPYGTPTNWLTAVTIDPSEACVDREELRRALLARGIESRPVWKPMHLQPVFRDRQVAGGGVAEELFADGLCLPSGSSLLDVERDEVIDIVRAVLLGRRESLGGGAQPMVSSPQ